MAKSEREKMMNVDEVAQWLKIHRSTVYRLIDKGELPAPMRVGRLGLRFYESEIRAFLDSKRVDKLE